MKGTTGNTIAGSGNPIVAMRFPIAWSQIQLQMTGHLRMLQKTIALCPVNFVDDQHISAYQEKKKWKPAF